MNVKQALSELRIIKADLSTALTKIRKANRKVGPVKAWSETTGPIYQFQQDELQRLCDSISSLVKEILK